MLKGSGNAAVFQPTLPARGATVESLLMASPTSHFNPRSPHGERRGIIVDGVAYVTFQPTLPARGATEIAVRVRVPTSISTHAPRTGSD